MNGENVAGLVLAVTVGDLPVRGAPLPGAVLMSAAGWGELIALIVLLAVTAPLLGRYMAHVYEGAPSRLDRVFGPVERLIYRACRIDPEREQRWNVYALSVLAFSVVGVLLLYADPAHPEQSAVQPDRHGRTSPPALSFNTAVSFMTNTNWQSYGGENTLSHLTQMMGLTVQNFVSAAAGMAVMVALIRGLSRAGQRTIGNFWVDLVRTTLRILLPLVVRVRGRAARVRRHPEHARLHDGPHRRRLHPADPGRAGGEPDRDQAARHERRRVLQRELHPPVREADQARRTSSSCTRSSSSRSRSRSRSDGMVKDKRQGYAVCRHHGRSCGSASAIAAR